MKSISNQLFFILIKSTGNKIRDAGAASLSDALKSNTTLTKLSLGCEHNISDTDGIHQQFIFFSIFFIESTGNKIGETGTASFTKALKTNTTLRSLLLYSEYKSNNT